MEFFFICPSVSCNLVWYSVPHLLFSSPFRETSPPSSRPKGKKLVECAGDLFLLKVYDVAVLNVVKPQKTGLLTTPMRASNPASG
jgi:hypothetical protein